MSEIHDITSPRREGVRASLWRARVVEVYGDGQVGALIPRLLGDQAIRIQSSIAGLGIGEDVVVGAIENSLDDLLVIARVDPFTESAVAFDSILIANPPTLPAHAVRKDYVDQLVGTPTTPVAHTHTANDISDATALGRVLVRAVDAAAARALIGAGTSSLAIGVTATTAKRGDYTPTWAEVQNIPATFAPSAHTHAAVDIADSTVTGRALLVASSAAVARATIGAGTSSLALGTTASTAMAGNRTFTKAEVGLGLVDNVADVDKPVSAAQAAAIAAAAETSFGFLIAAFTANGVSGEMLSLFYSPDGKRVFGGSQNPVFGADRLRDPSLIYQGGKFYVAYTLSDGVGRNFRIVSSETGAAGSWSVIATVDVSALVATGDKCWAPELVIEGDDVYVFFSWQKAKTTETTVGTGNGTGASMGWVRATNAALTTWTAPVALSTIGFPSSYIDGVPVRFGNDFYFFSSGSGIIYRAKSTTGIVGTYTQDKTGDWAGWGTGIEGPYITKIGAVYRIYFDRFVADTGHWFSDSVDLNTWTAPQQVSVAPTTLPNGGRLRHGSFLQLPSKEAENKALATTLASGVSYARLRQTKSIPNGAVTNMGPVTIEQDSRTMIRSAGTQDFVINPGGVFILSCSVAITSALGTASRVFVEYRWSNKTIARFPLGGEGEDTYTGSAQVTLPIGALVEVTAYQNQGSAKTFGVETVLTRVSVAD